MSINLISDRCTAFKTSVIITDTGSTAGTGKRLFSSSQSSDPTSYAVDAMGSVPGDRAVEHEVDYSLSFNI
jgi:hypothetical protein